MCKEQAAVFPAVPNQTNVSGRVLETGKFTSIAIMDCVLKTSSHPYAKGNLTRPSGKHFHRADNFSFDAMDHVTCNIPKSSFPARLHIFEDNVGVIRMTMNGRRPSSRHVSRTNRVDLDWLF